MPHPSTTPGPSPWVLRHADRIRPGGSVCDVACGTGRHSEFLASRGFSVTALDVDVAAIRQRHADPAIEILQADLESDPWPLPGRRFDAIVVVNYLHRPLFDALADALAGDGLLLYDTFAAGNERFGRPRNPDYLLQPGELLRAFGESLEVIAYEHGEVREPGPAIRQRLCAVRR